MAKHQIGRTTSGSISTIPYIGRIGTVELLGSVNIQVYQRRIGTIGHMGSSPYIGTVNRVAGGRIGSLGYLQNLGTLSSRGFIGTAQRSAVHTSRGSTQIGSWTDIRRHFMKTFEVQSTSTGTFAIIASMTGTATPGATGTYYVTRKGNGTYVSASFRENLRFVRFLFIPGSLGGSGASGKGTLNVTFSRQG